MHPLPDRYLDMVLVGLPAMVAEFSLGLQEALRLAVDRTGHVAERQATQEALRVLRAQGRVFAADLVQEVTERARCMGGGKDREAIPTDMMSLVDDAQVNESIIVSRVVAQVDQATEWEQRDLAALFSAVRGVGAIDKEANPLPASALVHAFWQAVKALPAPSQVHAAILRSAIAPLTAMARLLFGHVLQRLQQEGVQPAPYRAIVTASVAVPVDDSVARHPPMTPASVVAAWSQASRATLQGAHGASGPSARRQSSHARLSDVLGAFYAHLRSDRALPPGLRASLGRLQGNTLQLACDDPSLVESLDHPAWRFLDLAVEYGCGYRTVGHPAWSAWEAEVEQIVAALVGQPLHNAALYRRACASLHASAQGLRAQWLQAYGAVHQRLAHADAMDRWRAVYRARALTTLQDVPVSDLLYRFLTSTWVEALARVTVNRGEDAPLTRAWAAMPQELVESLRPVRSASDRQRLVGLLPQLLKRLSAGMDEVDLPPVRRQAVLDELVRLHTEILRGGDPLASQPPASPDAAAVFDDASGAVDVDMLATVPAELVGMDAAPQAASPEAWLDGLQIGHWYRLFLDSHWTSGRLMWCSERRAYFLFEGDAERVFHALTRRALLRLYGEGLAEHESHERYVGAVFDALAGLAQGAILPQG